MTKVEFIDRLILAAEVTRKFTSELEYVKETLPKGMSFTLEPYNDTAGARGPEGTIKFIGGRFLMPSELVNIPASRVGSLLWVNGVIPAWVNITITGINNHETKYHLKYCRTMVLQLLKH